MHIQIPRKTNGRVDFAAANRLLRRVGTTLSKLAFDETVSTANTPPTIEGSMVRLIISTRDERPPLPSRGRTSFRPLDPSAGGAA